MKNTTGPRRPLTADKRYSGQGGAGPRAGGSGGDGSGPPPSPSRQPRKSRPPRKRGNVVTRGVAGTVGLIWKVIWGSFWRLGLTAVLIVAAASFYYFSILPEASALMDGRARGSVTMMDRDGRVFAWRGETYNNVGLDQISPALKNAVVATEDKRFYSHMGISPRGIAGAIRTNIESGRGALSGAGGSTITVQLAKLLCLGETYDPTRWKSEAEYEAECRKSSLWRKVKEVPFAFAMEAKYSKDQILTIYMNRAYLGGGARGFEAASQRYFGKPAAEATPAEAAMLAGLLKAPSYFAPTANLQRSQDRAATILALMREQGYLTEAEYQDAIANPAKLSRAAAARAGGYFADWVMETGPAFLTSETTEDVTILTTFDQRIQRAAEKAVADVFKSKVAEGSKAQAAVVVMSADGAVRAIVGGRDNTADGVFNRATQARRQTGSSFKPFVYAAALDMGYSPQSMVLDAPLTIPVRGSKPWSPKNYSRNYRGEITLTQSLAQSINTSTIRLQEAVGRDAVRRVAGDFGFASDMPAGPALGLGVAESTLLEMTGAYAGIRNGGTAVKPYGLIELRIKGDDAPLIGQTGGMGTRVISQKAASELISMMKQVVSSGTGRRAQLDGREAAGKTGTTSSYRDAWFIGFTEQYVAGVWMGYDDNTPLQGVTGGGLPAEMWKAVMEAVHEGLPAEPLFVAASGATGTGVSSGQVVGDDPLAAALAGAIEGQAGVVPDAGITPDGTIAGPDADALSSALNEAMLGAGSPAADPAPAAPPGTTGSASAPLPADGGTLPADDALSRALQDAMRQGGN